MRRIMFLLLLAGGACSYTFDGEAPDLPLIGRPPDLTRLTKLNATRAGHAHIMLGEDQRDWLAFTETQAGFAQSVRVVQLGENPAQMQFFAEDIYIGYRTLYLLARRPDGSLLLSRVSPGQTAVRRSLTLPPGPALLLVGGPAERDFIYWVLDARTTSFLVFAGDVMRRFPILDGIDASDPLAAAQFTFVPFSGGGDGMLTRDGVGRVVLHALGQERDIDLGVRPRLNFVDGGRRLFVGCGSQTGLRTVPLDGGGETVLDPAGCNVYGDLWLSGSKVYYGVGDEVRRVRIDGSAAPETVLMGGRRVIGIGSDETILYSRDDANRYVHGAGDGWLGSWRFMQRGRAAGFSGDGARLRWLDHAARLNGSGDLLSAPAHGGAPLRLQRNVTQFEELNDGRVLVASNHAFRGTQNRVVVVNERARTVSWVAAGAAQFLRVPGSADVIVDIVSGASGYDLYRIPIPAP